MQGQLYRDECNDYYLIDNVGAYNYIVIKFGCFRSFFMSIDKVDNTMTKIEFNIDNIMNLLEVYPIFNGFIDYDYLESSNYIIYYKTIYYIRNWVDIFNFAYKIM